MRPKGREMHDAWDDDGADPAKRSRTETRRRLIEASPRVFVDRGIGGASVAQLCSAAGFTRGAFYSNFSSKEELATAIYVDHVDRLVDLLSHRVVEQLDAGVPYTEIFKGAIDAISGATGDSVWHLFRLEMHLASRRSMEVRQVVDEQYHRLLGAAEAALGHVQEHGIELKLPVEHLARLFVAVRDGEEMRLEGPPAESLLRTVWEAFTVMPPRDRSTPRS